MKTRKKTWRECQTEQEFKAKFGIELKALREAEESPIATARIMGIKRMELLTRRGWRILSHSPSNYAHAANRYVMVIDTPVLVGYIEKAKAAHGIS